MTRPPTLHDLTTSSLSLKILHVTGRRTRRRPPSSSCDLAIPWRAHFISGDDGVDLCLAYPVLWKILHSPQTSPAMVPAWFPSRFKAPRSKINQTPTQFLFGRRVRPQKYILQPINLRKAHKDRKADA